MNPTPQPNQLPRVLGAWMAIALVIGTIIGSGVFKKATQVSKGAEEFGLVLTAWVLAGIITLIGALILAEVAVLLPKAGGNYVFLKEGYGRWAGFLWGWVEFWIIRSGSIAALATIFSEQVHAIIRAARGTDSDVLSFWTIQGMTITVIAVLAIVNARGTRLGGGLQLIITTVKVASLILIALLPFIVVGLTSEPRARPNADYLSPLWPKEWTLAKISAFGGALVGVFWAYHGWMNIAPVAEEVKNPHRNIPLALIVGVVGVIALYVAVNVAYYLVLSRGEILKLAEHAQERTVATEFSAKLLGSSGLILAATAVMLSVFGALNGNLLVGPRLLFAMGRDGLAPRAFSILHARFQTPALAGATLTCWAILLVIGVGWLTQTQLPTLQIGSRTFDLNLPQGSKSFDVVTDFAMFGAISFETMAVSAVFVLRRRYPKDRVQVPYRCPLYPVLPVIYVLFMGAVLLNMFLTHRTIAMIGLGFMLIGAGIYALFLRNR